MFKHSTYGKGMVYGLNRIYPNGKDIMVPIEYTFMVYSFTGKGMVL